MSAQQVAIAVDLTSTLVDRIVGLEIASAVGVVLLDAAGDPQLTTASHASAARLTHVQIEHAEGPSHDSCTDGLSTSAPDLTQIDGRWPTFTPAALAAGFRSVLTVPLRLRGVVLGAMTLLLTAPGDVSPGGLTVVRAMTDIATIGLQQQHELAHARDVESQLQHALLSRISIEQAKGILSEQADITTDAAFVLLRRYARDHNHRIADVAAEVVDHTTTSDDLSDDPSRDV